MNLLSLFNCLSEKEKICFAEYIDEWRNNKKPKYLPELELPKNKQIIEITESFGDSKYLFVGARFRVISAFINKRKERINIKAQHLDDKNKIIIIRSNIYKYKIIA